MTGTGGANRATRTKSVCLRGGGFLAGRLVFWPTTCGVKVLQQEDGTPPDDLMSLTGTTFAGNLAYARGCLAVTDTRTLYIYLSPGAGCHGIRRQ